MTWSEEPGVIQSALQGEVTLMGHTILDISHMMFYRETLGPVINVDVTLTRTTYRICCYNVSDTTAHHQGVCAALITCSHNIRPAGFNVIAISEYLSVHTTGIKLTSLPK